MSEPHQKTSDDPCQHNPYPGLRPYEENEQDQFFGRDADTQILLDKVLTHRLTLLFAATGVGKSSLLKAAVIPKLKSASGKHLDVVYYNDWVTTPLVGLKAEIAKTVKQSANWPQGTMLDESLSLPDFVQFCTLFVRPPLVIMLDQFEELFRYRHKYHKDTFKPFIEELTGLITDTRIPVSIVFSMREDFALELNAFKPKLPTLLFENYYRLERLPSGAARQAIVQPLSTSRFSYEPELLEQLLEDLLHNDPDRDLSSLGANDETETVIPPQLQIVCSQLWQMECASPDRTLHLAAYEQAGRAKGLLKNYVGKSLTGFSQPDRRVLSRVFDHLVSIQGTKMPHTINTLAEKTRDEPKYLMKLLDRLASQDVRILRSQQREKQTWYELYHDMYSESINDWNRVQKRKMFWRQFRIWGAAVSCFSLVAYFGTVAYVHSVSHHLRLAPGDDNRVEIFNGKYGWPDPFNQKQFYSETTLLSRDIEPDKRFERRGVMDYLDITDDLIGYRPLVDRITAYIQNGNYQKAHELYDKTVNSSNGRQARAVVRGLSGLKTDSGFLKIKQAALSEKNAPKNQMALAIIEENIMALPLKDLHPFRVFEQSLKAGEGGYRMYYDRISTSPQLVNKLLSYTEHTSDTVRESAVSAIGRMGSINEIAPLIKLLGDDSDDVRSSVAEALGQIGDSTAVEPLLKWLSQKSVGGSRDNYAVVEALGQIGDRAALDALINFQDDEEGAYYLLQAIREIGGPAAATFFISALKDPKKPAMQFAAALELGLIGEAAALEPLTKLLDNESEILRQTAALSLGTMGVDAPIELIIKILDSEEADPEMQSRAAKVLGLIGVDAIRPLVKSLGHYSEEVSLSAALALANMSHHAAVEQLLGALNSDSDSVRSIAAIAIGMADLDSALMPLIKALNDDVALVRMSAAESLGLIGNQAATEQLINVLNDEDETVRASAAKALGKLTKSSAVKPLIKALVDENKAVREAAAKALGNIKNPLAIEPLIKALDDDNNNVRRTASQALAAIGKLQALESLNNALVDDDGFVRESVTEGLAQIGSLGNVHFKRASPKNNKKKEYHWQDFYAGPIFTENLTDFHGLSLADTLTDVYGTEKSRRFLLSVLNQPISRERDTALLQLASNPDFHSTIRVKAIYVLAKQGADNELIIKALRSMNPSIHALKKAARAVIKSLTKPHANDQSYIDKYGKRMVTANVAEKLEALVDDYAEWRQFRDSKAQNDYIKAEDYDDFLQQVRQRKAKIDTNDIFEYAYDLSRLDPKAGLSLLNHSLALVRQGAYTAFVMKANIEWLEKIDKLREQRRDNPIFRHAAFRVIDLALWRLEVLGNKGDDREYTELMAWQKKLVADKNRRIAMDKAGDKNDEVLERLKWTTMMMEHNKEVTAKYAKDGWERNWPEHVEPVNQKYPEPVQ